MELRALLRILISQSESYSPLDLVNNGSGYMLPIGLYQTITRSNDGLLSIWRLGT